MRGMTSSFKKLNQEHSSSSLGVLYTTFVRFFFFIQKCSEESLKMNWNRKRFSIFSFDWVGPHGNLDNNFINISHKWIEKKPTQTNRLIQIQCITKSKLMQLFMISKKKKISCVISNLSNHFFFTSHTHMFKSWIANDVYDSEYPVQKNKTHHTHALNVLRLIQSCRNFSIQII